MIIVDYSKVAIAAILTTFKGGVVETDLARHFILNSLREKNTRFKKEYGPMVIALDANKYWRRDIFPYYKAKRQESRDNSFIDWESMFAAMDAVKTELRDILPWPTVRVDRCEADDIIGTLTHTLASQGERILIVASDRDFDQLEAYQTVRLYCPTKRKVQMPSGDPEFKLFEKICKGDKGDGIPNIRSADDALVQNVRQKPVTDKFIRELYKATDKGEHERNFCRNRDLIDLSKVPSEYQSKILEDYQSQLTKTPGDVTMYLMEHRLKNLMEHAQDLY